MNVLVLNCGSSSLKFQVIQTDLDLIEQNSDRCLAHGMIERIRGAALISMAAKGQKAQRSAMPVRDIKHAVDIVVRWLISEESGVSEITSLTDIHAIGHRVVHGGERFKASVMIDDEVLHGIEDCIELAPLHNPANIQGINAAREMFGRGLPQAATFDTAFHQSLPEKAFLYAIPYQLYRRHKIRRYGFHGTSHRYIAYRYRTMLGIPRENVNVITLHLGNGCSIAAIKNGDPIDTSMGMTPLEGLMMGTRSGDIDPAILEYLCAKEGFTMSEVETLLNKQSGLLGVSGLTHDMRDLLAEMNENNDRRSRLAVELFCYRIAKYVGAYFAAMGGADALLFSGGIGENAPQIRAMVVKYLEWFGVVIDEHWNGSIFGGAEGKISKDESRVAMWVIPTNEEMLIARDTVRLIEGVL